MPREPGDSKRKLPERADALNIDLPWEEALRAALEVKPPADRPKKVKPKRPKSSR
jgi:hypothetical protein